MTGRQHQPANCIIRGWLGLAGQGRWDQAEGSLPVPCSWLARCHRAAVVRGLKGWPWSPLQGQAAGKSLAMEQGEVKASYWITPEQRVMGKGETASGEQGLESSSCPAVSLWRRGQAK